MVFISGKNVVPFIRDFKSAVWDENFRLGGKDQSYYDLTTLDVTESECENIIKSKMYLIIDDKDFSFKIYKDIIKKMTKK